MGQLTPSPPSRPALTRSGFVALAGRPNVGKSTLANAIVGAKVAIVSDKPQTTRRAIRGVANGPGWQLILVDLPGVQRPRDALTERMQHRVEHELADADGCLLVVNAQQGLGPGDRFIATLLRSANVPVTVAVNKVDRAEKARVAATLHDAEGLDIATEIFPVSARTGAGVPALVDHLVGLLPEGPLYFSSRAALGPVPLGDPRRAGARAGSGAHAGGDPPRGRGRGRGHLAIRAPIWCGSRPWSCRRPSPRRASSSAPAGA